jgi:CubicO group peptidase (beta-lactamase class C family)
VSPIGNFAQIAGIAATIVAVLAAAIPQGRPAIDRAFALEEQIRGTMEASGIPGLAVGVVEDGEVVHLSAFGMARPAEPMTAQTPVVIGSVGKSITALAIRQLVEAGRLELDSPVTRYLPWFVLDAPAQTTERITIRSLIDHTSGISTAAGQSPALYSPGRTPEDLVRGLATLRPGNPGVYEYSNLNYVVLGVILEAVSGTTYGEYVSTYIFEPLGMTRSYTDLDAASLEHLAQGHRYLFGLPFAFDEPYPTGMVAAGYQISTAADMARYVAALTNGGVYRGTDVVPADSPSSEVWGYGTDWMPLTALQAGSILSQSGSTLSSNADILVLPSSRVGVVVLLNANPTQLMGVPAGAADIAREVLREWTGAGSPTNASNVRTVYLAVDLVLLLLISPFTVHAWRARSWRRRLANTRHRGFMLGRTIVADAALPIAVLGGLPLLIGMTGSSPSGDVLGGWAFALWTLPDIAVTVLALALGGLLVGAIKLTASRAQPRPDLLVPRTVNA